MTDIVNFTDVIENNITEYEYVELNETILTNNTNLTEEEYVYIDLEDLDSEEYYPFHETNQTSNETEFQDDEYVYIELIDDDNEIETEEIEEIIEELDEEKEVEEIEETSEEEIIEEDEYIYIEIDSELKDEYNYIKLNDDEPLLEKEEKDDFPIILQGGRGGDFYGGNGTESNPYLISTPTHLYNVRTNLTAHYRLNNSIDLNVSPYNESSGWWPIGNATTSFNGNLNGDGYVIYNLYINIPTSDDLGLFGDLGVNSNISNLGLINVNITGQDYIGGLVGFQSSGGLINNCYITGTIMNSNRGGGLAGEASGTIRNSYADVNITGVFTVGGLVGGFYGTIEKCFAKGNVEGENDIGGLAGENFDGSITDSYAIGSVTSNVNDGNVGGLVGYVGFAGSIENSYSIGIVSGNEWYRGGLIGESDSALISNSFYNSDTSGQSDDDGRGEPKTTAEMKDLDTFDTAGWDIGYTSVQDLNDGYPFLSWQLGNSPIWVIYQESSISINNISIIPDLDISRFSPYNVTANITNLTSIDKVLVNISGINGQGENCWDYYVNGTCGSETLEFEMNYLSNNIWEKTNVFPDYIYPEIYFATSDITWYNVPLDISVWRNNYHILKFENPFIMDSNMSFWIEFYTAPGTHPNPQDIQIYLVDREQTITYFQDDWRNKAGVELVGSKSSNDPLHHTHTANSSHHLVALSANEDGTFGTKNLNISDNFWIVIYSNSPNIARGWDLKYHPDTLCDNQNAWYRGSVGGWTTTAQSGCPDMHIHLARRENYVDGVNLTVFVNNTDGDFDINSEQYYFGDLPNLPPNPSSFIYPTNGSFGGTFNITWNPATDPNNDELNYTLYLLNSSGDINATLVANTTLTYFTFDSTLYDDGVYDLMVVVCDQEPLCVNFTHSGSFDVFNINNSFLNLTCWFDPVFQEPEDTRDVWCNLTYISGNPILNANISHSTFDTNDWFKNNLMDTKGWFIGYHSIPNAYNLTDVSFNIVSTKRIDSISRAQINYGPFFYPFPHINQTFSILTKAGSEALDLRIMICNHTYSDEIFSNTPIEKIRVQNYEGCQEAGLINATDFNVNPFNWTWISIDITEAYNNITKNQQGVKSYSIHLASDSEFLINPVGWVIDDMWMPPMHPETKEAYTLYEDDLYLPDENELPEGCGYSKEINKSGNVLHFRFNEESGTNIKDYSCVGNNGTIYDNPVLNETGNFNQAIDLTSDRRSRVVVPHDDSLNLGNEGTLMTWIYLQENTPYGGIFHKGSKADFSDEAYSFQLLTTGNELSLYMRNSGGTTDQLTSSQSLPLETWYHIVATWDGTRWVIYINGEESVSKNSNIIPRTSTGSLQVGAQLNESYDATLRMLSFNGRLDESMVFDRTLSSEEIKIHYLKGVRHFLPDDRVHNTSGDNFWSSNNLLTLSETVDVNETTGFIHFKEDTDYVEFKNITSFKETLDGEFTSCLFFKHDHYENNVYKYWVCGQSMELIYIGGRFRLAVQREGGTGWTILNSPIDLSAASDGEWHHLCGVRDIENEELRLILDGELIASMSFSSTYVIRDFNQCVLGRDGNLGGNDEWFRGQMAHYFFHNDSHGESEISEGINSAFWELAIGERITEGVYLTGNMINETHTSWENEPRLTPIAFTKIYNMNNESAYMIYNETNQLYHYTYYTSTPQLLASQGKEGVNFTTLFNYNDIVNTTEYWYVKALTNATCNVSIEWNNPAREGQYQLARINFSSNSSSPLTVRRIYVCEENQIYPNCTLFTGFGNTFHRRLNVYGNTTVYCEVQNDFMDEPYISNDTIEVSCWNPYNDYDGTKNPLTMESDIYICPGTHYIQSKNDGDYSVLRNSGDFKLFLLGSTVIDGNSAYYQGVNGAWNTMYWAYNLRNRVFDPKGFLVVQNAEIGFFTDTSVENYTFANVHFINVSIPFDLQHSIAYNFTIVNNSFTNCGVNGQDAIYITGPNARIIHNHFYELHPTADSNVYCDGCVNVTLEQNYYWDIENLSIYSLGNNRTVNTTIGNFTCEIGEIGNQYPYANYETISENYLNDARLFGEIKDEFPCTNKILPLIVIVSPINTTYSSKKQLVEILNNSAESVWYNWEGTNVTYTGPINITFDDGVNVLHAWGNDSNGVEFYANVTFTIDTTLTILTIEFVPPTELNSSTITEDNTIVNVTYTSGYNTSGFIDFNNDLLGYWNFEYYSGTTVYDNSSYSYDATLINSAFVNDDITEGIRGKSLSLNGVNRYARVPHESEFNVLGEFTIEVWVNEGVQNYQWAQILNRDRDNGFNLQHNSLNTQFEFAVRTNTGRTFILAEPPGGLQTGVWYHVVGVYNGTNIMLYIDGVLRNTGTRSGNVTQSTSPLFIGARGAATGGVDRYFNGSIDEVKFWNRALTLQEINNSFHLNSEYFHSTYEDLELGEHNFRACVINSKGEFECTETRTITYSDEVCVNLTDSSTYNGKITNVSGKYYIQEDIEFCEGIYEFNTSDILLEFNSTKQNLTVDCSNSIFIGNGSGLFMNSEGMLNTTIRNCFVSTYNVVFNFNDTVNSYFNNNHANDSQTGLNLYNTTIEIDSSFFYNNTNDGIYIDENSNISLSLSRVCYNTLDINSETILSTGFYNRCDSFLNWTEQSRRGCAMTCSDIWHRFIGKVEGGLVLSDNVEVFYLWDWTDLSGGKIYAVNSESTIDWTQTYAIGKTKAEAQSTGDFEILDDILSLPDSLDNINYTYSIDGSIPILTSNKTLFYRDVNYVPLANSTFLGLYKTGILWDGSDTIGNEFTGGEDVIFVGDITYTAAGTYVDNISYEIMIPKNFDIYTDPGAEVYFYIELE